METSFLMKKKKRKEYPIKRDNKKGKFGYSCTLCPVNRLSICDHPDCELHSYPEGENK